MCIYKQCGSQDGQTSMPGGSQHGPEFKRKYEQSFFVLLGSRHPQRKGALRAKASGKALGDSRH